MNAIRFQYRLRERARGVQVVPGSRRVAAEHVDLADVRRGRVHAVERRGALVTGTARAAAAARQPLDVGEVAVGDRQVPALIVVGGRAEHVERLREAQPPRVVRGHRQVLELAAVGLEAVRALRELHRLAVHDAVVAGVADHSPDAVVGRVLEVRRSGVRVPDAPAAVQHLTGVRFVVAVRVLEEQEIRLRRDDDPAVGEGEAARHVEVLGKDGELVRAAVAVRVFEDLDPVVARVAVEDFVRIVHRLDHPQAAALVERHGDRLDDVGLAREQLDLELARRLDELQRVRRRERQLIPGGRIALLVVRHVEPVHVGDRRHLHLLPGLARGIVHGPGDGALDQRLELGLAPRALVVAVGRVEDASFPLRADPRPRFPALRVHALHQHRPIDGVVLRVHVGFVPRQERLHALRDRVRGLDDLGGELAGAVPLKLAADERDVLVRLRELRRGRVQRDEPAASLDEIEQRLLLLRRDRFLVAEQHHRVVVPELRGGQRVGGGGDVGQLNAAARQRRGQQRKHPRRVVRLVRVLAEEEDFDRPPRGARRRRPRTLRRLCLGHQRQAAQRKRAAQKREPNLARHGAVESHRE